MSVRFRSGVRGRQIGKQPFSATHRWTSGNRYIADPLRPRAQGQDWPNSERPRRFSGTAVFRPKRKFSLPIRVVGFVSITSHPVIPGLYSKAVIHTSYGYPLRFRRDPLRRLLKRGVSVGAIDTFGNRARKRRAMLPTGPSRVIADSMTAAAVRR